MVRICIESQALARDCRLESPRQLLRLRKLQGTKTREAYLADRRMDAISAWRSGAPPTFSGTDLELELAVQPVTRATRPIAGKAWVRYPEGPAKVDAWAAACSP